MQYSRDIIKVQNLGNPSFEEHLTAASASYMQAARLQEEAGRSVQLFDVLLMKCTIYHVTFTISNFLN